MYNPVPTTMQALMIRKIMRADTATNVSFGIQPKIGLVSLSSIK